MKKFNELNPGDPVYTVDYCYGDNPHYSHSMVGQILERYVTVRDHEGDKMKLLSIEKGSDNKIDLCFNFKTSGNKTFDKYPSVDSKHVERLYATDKRLLYEYMIDDIDDTISEMKNKIMRFEENKLYLVDKLREVK